jgi:hypothetical protein
LEDARAFLLSSYLAPTISQLLQQLNYLSLSLCTCIAGINWLMRDGGAKKDDSNKNKGLFQYISLHGPTKHVNNSWQIIVVI